MFFESCRCIEDVKKVYRDLAKKLHPDCNPGRDTAEDFRRMQAEYTKAFNRLKTVHRMPGQETTEGQQAETYEKASSESAQEYADIIDRLIHLDGLTIEVIGSWLWITGNTKEHKDILKELGFHWASKKQAWYYHKEPWLKRGGRKSLDEIRATYGSTEVKTEKAKEIA